MAFTSLAACHDYDGSDCQEIHGFESLDLSLLTLYQAMLGNFDFSVFSERSELTRVAAFILLALYLLASMVTLLNLLIAVMTQEITST